MMGVQLSRVGAANQNQNSSAGKEAQGRSESQFKKGSAFNVHKETARKKMIAVNKENFRDLYILSQ